MPKYNPANERVKRKYLDFLAQAKGRATATIDCVAASLARFDASTGHKDFKRFHRQQAAAFKTRLRETPAARSGKPLGKATMLSIMRDLKAFFEWLAREPGYRSHIQFSDASYFNMSDRDIAIAYAPREKVVPSLDQVHHVLSLMPTDTVLERRDRALVAFTAITGARVKALTTFRVRHVNLKGGFVEQDAREVETKFGKSFRTAFMPFCSDALEIVTAWVCEIREQHMWGPDDPLFPATTIGLGDTGMFKAQCLARHGWASTGPIRDIFRRAFERADLPYANPHSFRDMLVRHATTLDLTPEEMKAFSQNLGHSAITTTLTSYGSVPVLRQIELIKARAVRQSSSKPSDDELSAAFEIMKFHFGKP